MKNVKTLEEFYRTGREMLRAEFCKDYGHDYADISSPKVLVFEGGVYAEIDTEENPAGGKSEIYHLAIHNRSWMLFNKKDVARLLWNVCSKYSFKIDEDELKFDIQFQMDEICVRNNINYIDDYSAEQLKDKVDREIAFSLWEEYEAM